MNSIASIATVATGPCARRDATMPAAMSIWESTQPPKMWPLALMSPGRGTTRRIGSRLAFVVVMASRGGGLVAGPHRSSTSMGTLVMAGAVAEEDQAHAAGAEQHGGRHASERRDDHVERHLAALALKIEKREQRRRDRGQRHPPHH